ncbi:winged helix-turn-helix domain-containing protein [Bordetella petrii]|nr:winged helix-turn-helix domain-containing protein [Bordetella petrii]
MSTAREGCSSMDTSVQKRSKNLCPGGDSLVNTEALARSVLQPADLKVVYLTLSSDSTARHSDDLRAFGFEVSVYSSVAAMRSAISVHAPAIVALEAEPTTVHLAVAQLRLVLRRASIVVVSRFPDRLSRVGAMLSGADACVDAMPDSLELMAALLASKRRLQIEEELQSGVSSLINASAKPDAPEGKSDVTVEFGPNAQWHLAENGWILVAPNGTRIDLNHSERKIMTWLLSNPKQPLTRVSQGASYDLHNGRITRRLDVAISRLRRKATAHSLRLPIRSIRGEGYVFE